MPILANGIFDDDDDCSEEDFGVDEGGDDEDDDVLLLSIQKRFGSFEPAQDQPQPSPLLFEEEDDEEILRAVQERFSSTTTTPAAIKTDKVNKVVGKGTNQKAKRSCTNICGKVSVEDVPESEMLSASIPTCDVSLSPASNPEPTGFTFPGQVEVFSDAMEDLSDEPVDGVVYDDDLLEDLADDCHGQSIRTTLDALKKNRLCQRVLTSKLELVKLKLEENKDLKKRVSALLDYQGVAKRKYPFEENSPNLGVAVFCNEGTKDQQHSIWPRIPPGGGHWGKGGPSENADAANFRAMQKKYCVKFEPKGWTKEEKNELIKGVEQQVQESRIRAVMDTHRAGSNDATFLDDQVRTIAEHPPMPEDIRATLPIVNWNEVARLYVITRSPTECWIQWSNYEDCLIDQGPWTKAEDKRLWSIAKQHKLCNWERICKALGSQRSISQCLIRYQRSLNVGIMRGAWTREEDKQLRAAVHLYGDQDWSSIATTLEGRTGSQCWNRWHKILHPVRKKCGRWNIDEDKRLKVAVSVYGPKMWKVIATHVPGRTEVQCRERWCNILDPSLISAEWTAEEDQRLEAAIAKHGLHRWSAVALDLSPRTDNQCWRRWKFLYPELLPAFQKDNRIQKAALVSNFVGRRKEKSDLLPSDFVPKPGAFDKAKELISKSRRSDGTENPRKGVKRKRASKESSLGGVGEELTVDGHVVTPEFSKMRRMQRLEKIRQARAAGKLLVWKRPTELRTGLGVERQAEPAKRSVRSKSIDGLSPRENGSIAFVNFVHELANFCGKDGRKSSKFETRCFDMSTSSGRRSKADQFKTEENLSSTSKGVAGNIPTANSEMDEQVEAAVKAVLSWPFIWSLQQFCEKAQNGL